MPSLVNSIAFCVLRASITNVQAVADVQQLQKHCVLSFVNPSQFCALTLSMLNDEAGLPSSWQKIRALSLMASCHDDHSVWLALLEHYLLVPTKPPLLLLVIQTAVEGAVLASTNQATLPCCESFKY